METSDQSEEIINVALESNETIHASRSNSDRTIDIPCNDKEEYEQSINDSNSEYDVLLVPKIKDILSSSSSSSSSSISNSLNLIHQKKRNLNRLYWADCARIFSMLCIIFLHSSGYTFEKSLRKKKNPNWIIVCWYNCITRFSVPMFVLLSGTFILDPSRKFTFKKLFCHNILRLSTAFAFWSTLNALINIFLYKKNKLQDFVKLFFVGEEYLWFIYMIIGCYLISPFLRYFSNDVVVSRYFLGLCVFWGSLVPTLKNIFTVYKFKDAKTELVTWTSRWHYHFTLEFVGYFVAGYHIVKHVNIRSKLTRSILYLIGLLDAILICYLTYSIESKSPKRYSKEFRDNYSLTIVIYSVILFIFFKHEIGRIYFPNYATKIISKLSSLTFGMYLSHLIIKNLLSKYLHISQTNFFGNQYSPVIGVPIFAFSITIVSLLVSFILSKIPILKNYVL